MSKQTMTQVIADYFKTQPVLKAWLFGSFARGDDHEDSDVDLLVEFDRSIPIGLFAYARMHRELEEKLGRMVDLVEEGTLRAAVQMTANRNYENTQHWNLDAECLEPLKEFIHNTLK